MARPKGYRWALGSLGNHDPTPQRQAPWELRGGKLRSGSLVILVHEHGPFPGKADGPTQWLLMPIKRRGRAVVSPLLDLITQ